MVEPRARWRTPKAWRFADGFTERLRYEIDPKWQGDSRFRG